MNSLLDNAMSSRQRVNALIAVAVIEPRVVWFSVLVPILVVFLFAASGPLSAAPLPRRVAWAAGVLQILGIVGVAIGLHRLRVDLGQPPLRTVVGNWLEKFRRTVWPGKAVTVGITGVAAGSAVGEANLQARGVGVDSDSMESRVAALEQRVEWLEGDLQRKVGEVNRRVDRLSSDLETERQERSADDRAQRELLTKLFIGGLDLEVAGLAWILAGLVLGTWPEAIASWSVLQWFSAGP